MDRIGYSHTLKKAVMHHVAGTFVVLGLFRVLRVWCTVCCLFSMFRPFSKPAALRLVRWIVINSQDSWWSFRSLGSTKNIYDRGTPKMDGFFHLKSLCCAVVGPIFYWRPRGPKANSERCRWSKSWRLRQNYRTTSLVHDDRSILINHLRWFIDVYWHVSNIIFAYKMIQM